MKRRGDIWWVNFDPSVGSEIQKRRPAVIVSNNNANKHLPRFQVVPFTSNTERIYPGEALVNFSGGKSKAKADQLTTVSEERMVSKAGKLSASDLKLVEKAIQVQLGLLEKKKEKKK